MKNRGVYNASYPFHRYARLEHYYTSHYVAGLYLCP